MAQASLFRRDTNAKLQTNTEPVPLKHGKLAAKYPWIYTDSFTVYRFAVTWAVRCDEADLRCCQLVGAVQLK